MRDKLDGLARLTKAMTAKKRAQDMQVVVLNTRLESLQKAEDELTSALNADAVFSSGLAPQYIKRLERIAQQRELLAADLQRRKLERLESSRDLRRCEIMEQRQALKLRKAEEARQLERAIEGHLTQKPPQASGK
jgi:hypothetical protein